MRYAILALFIFMATAACSETSVQSGDGSDGDIADGDGEYFADGDEDSPEGDGYQVSGDADEVVDGDDEAPEGEEVDSACTPDDYRCREAVLERCSLAGEWEFYRDCALDGMECAAGDCIQSPDGDDEAEPDMDGDGFEDADDTEEDAENEIENEIEADSEPESEAWDIDPDDVVIGEECPQQGISLCKHQVVIVCNYQLEWVYVVNCADDENECWQGECVDPENTSNYPGCTQGDSRCVGDTVQWCTNPPDWNLVGVDCTEDGNVCYLGECVHD